MKNKNKNLVFCKGGKEINDARIVKYEGFYRTSIAKFLPALCLSEAAMSYEDLLNQLRYEAFMALKNGFDPIKAMTSTIADPVKREAQIAKKLANPTWALEQAEINIVCGRIFNYLRRKRYDFHPNTRGGRSVSLDAILCNVGLDDEGAGIDPFTIEDKPEMNTPRAEEDYTELMELLAEGEDVRRAFMKLSEDRRESVMMILKGRSVSMLDNVDWDEAANPEIVLAE